MTIRSAILWALLALPLPAVAVNFAWDYPAGTSIVGFKLYCGTATGAYAGTPVATVPASTKSATVNFAAGTTSFCAVAAYDNASQSPYSNEVSVVSPPSAPTNLRLTLLQVYDPKSKQNIWIITAVSVDDATINGNVSGDLVNGVVN